MAERKVNEQLVWSFESAGILAPEQAGFRIGLSPRDQVNVFMQEVANGFQRYESTYVVFVDLKQAHDWYGHWSWAPDVWRSYLTPPGHCPANLPTSHFRTCFILCGTIFSTPTHVSI